MFTPAVTCLSRFRAGTLQAQRHQQLGHIDVDRMILILESKLQRRGNRNLSSSPPRPLPPPPPHSAAETGVAQFSSALWASSSP